MADGVATLRPRGFTARLELGYHAPDYPDADNPTTVWSLEAGDFHG